MHKETAAKRYMDPPNKRLVLVCIDDEPTGLTVNRFYITFDNVRYWNGQIDKLSVDDKRIKSKKRISKKKKGRNI